ncbi:MAG TPA: hypothetical protein VK432_03605 [Stellaceae bacterium]|nr:hypothetical protein [Stellaceae bacterium]
MKLAGAFFLSLGLLTAFPAAAQEADPFREAAPPPPMALPEQQAVAPAPPPKPRPAPAPEPQAEPVVAAPPPRAPPSAPKYDGVYTGEATRSVSASGRCVEPSFTKTMTVKDNQFSYAFGGAESLVVTGQIGDDGSLTGFTKSLRGGVRVTGKIEGGRFSGQAISPGCILDLNFQK